MIKQRGKKNMAFDFVDFAAIYGVRKQPTIVTDSNLNTKFVNHFAALLSVMQLDGDFIRRSLTPASMQKVQRCRRTKKSVVFTQYFGKTYREKYLVEAQWEHNEYIVFTFHRAHGEHDEQPLIDTLAEGNMEDALNKMLAISDLLEQTPDLSAKQISDRVREAAFNVIRCARQTQNRYAIPECYSFHMATLLDHILKPVNALLKEKGVNYKINYPKLAGKNMVKCDGNLFRYVLYSLLSTTMSMKKQEITLHYEEYPDCVRLEIFSGKERPVIISSADPEASHAICDSLSLTAAYVLIEKMQGELDARRMSDGGMRFTLTMPSSQAVGGFKEHIAQQLQESLSTLKIEFSIL